MPFVRDLQTIGPIGRLPEEAEAERPSFLGETIPAAFRMENTIGSAMAGGLPLMQRPDPAFDPFTDLAGYETEADSFVYANSRDDVAKVKLRIDRERADRDTLEKAGWEGMAATFAAGAVDPVNLIPIGGSAYRAYRIGGSILKDGLHVARAGLLGSTAAEAVLQGTQETRTAEESATNIAGATFLAGMLGSGVGFARGFLAKRGGKTLDDIAKGIEDDLTVPPPDVPDPNQPGAVRMTAEDLAADTGGSVGAAAVKQTTLAEEKLKSALGIEKAIKFTSPLLRTAMSRSVEVRRTVQELAETPFYYDKNALGVATPVAVERRVRMWNGPLADSLAAVKDAHTEYRKAGGKLSRTEFNVEVGRAMRRGDKSAIPEVARAAKTMRETLFDPLKDEAIRLGLLPEDVKPETALSYLTRVYDTPKIIAEQPAFVARVTDWLRGQQADVGARLEEAEELVVSTRQSIEKLDSELTISRQEEKLTGADLKKGTERSSRVERDVVAARKALADAERQAKAFRERAAKLEPTAGPAKDDPLRETLADLRRGGPKEKPLRLTDWARRNGGLKESGGELASMGIKQGAKGVGPKLLNADGMNLDDAARKAWEDGFIPGEERPDINEFLARLRDDFNDTNPVYREADADLVAYKDYLDDLGRALEDMGIDPAKATDAQIAHALESAAMGQPQTKIVESPAKIVSTTRGKVVTINSIKTPEGKRGQGFADAALIEFLEKADEQRMTVALSPAADWGASVSRLKAWYRRHGFVENKGRNRDLEINESMIRAPQTREAGATGRPTAFRPSTAATRAQAREASYYRRLQDRNLGKAATRAEKAEAALIQAQRAREEANVAARALKEKNAALESNLNGARTRLKKLQDRIEGDRYLGAAEDQELQDIAEEIFHKITSSPGGRTSYESFDIQALKRGPLKERTFNIPDEMIEDFLESDVDTVARFYSRTMAADVELTRAFGRADMTAQLGKIRDDYTRLAREATDPKQRQKINKAMRDDIRDIEGMRDRIRGTYAAGSNPNAMLPRIIQLARDWNFMRLGGMIALSSVPDIGRPMMVHGLSRFFGDGVVPLAKNLRAIRLAGKEVKMAGTALDMTLNTRAASAYDIGDDFGRLSKVERFSRYATDKFSVAAVISPWNSALKQWVGAMSGTRIFEESAAWASGKINPKNAEYLAMLGVDESLARKIARQFAQHGETVDGVRIANTAAWTDREALVAFRGALAKDVDRIIVTPGEDRPLWMSSQLGKLIGQYKTFSMASAHRVLLAGLQQRDMAALNGAALMTALGALRYATGEWMNGKEVTADPVQLIAEGVDRAGLLGWLSDANNLLEKASGGQLGVGAAIGKPLSRSAYRNLLQTLAGPSGGIVQDAAAIFARSVSGEAMTEADARAVRRLLPFQNHVAARMLFDQAEAGIAEALGAAN